MPTVAVPTPFRLLPLMMLRGALVSVMSAVLPAAVP